MLSDPLLRDAEPRARAVRLGAGAMAIAQIASQLISLAGLAILMRLLVPADYGLIGMVFPLIMLLRIFSTFGLNIATVQRQRLGEGEATSLFWMNLWLGLVATGATVAVAPAVGWLYGRPELSGLLSAITMSLAATTLISALGAQHTALMERKMRQPQIARLRIFAQLCAALAAIVTAYAGGGVWALVVAQYVELSLTTVLVWWLEPWRPGWPRHGVSVAPWLRWGGLFAASSLVLYLADHLDRILVGRLIGPTAVGLYERAWALTVKPIFLVTTPLTGLLLASLARASHADQQRQSMLVAFYRVTSILLLPTSCGLAVVAGDVMQVIGGARWTAAGPLLGVLSLGIFAHAIVILNGYVLTAAGRTDRLLIASLVVLTVLAAGYVAGYGIGQRFEQPTLGVAAGYAIAITLLCLPHTLYAVRTARLSLPAVLATWRRPLVASLVMAWMVALFGQWLASAAPAVRLVVLVPLGVAMYAALARQEIAWLVAHVQQLRPTKPSVPDTDANSTDANTDPV